MTNTALFSVSFRQAPRANTYTYPARKRLVALLSDAALVTEDRVNGISLLTAQAARDYVNRFLPFWVKLPYQQFGRE